MRLLAPAYYPHFACIAGACRHSCCKGWEIDVDEASLRRFQQVKGPLGQRLRDALTEDDVGAHFALLGEEERCPFLNGQGLCDLILGLGEDSLCQICADHPRFRSFFADHTEIGLGLCCEAAAQLVLTWPDKPALIELRADAEPPAPADALQAALEAEVTELRDALTALAQDRSRPMPQRVADMARLLGYAWPCIAPADWAAELLALERLDPAWTDLLQALREAQPKAIDLSALETPLEQLMVYLLYRHLPAALEDGQAAAHGMLCCMLWQTAVWLLALGAPTLPRLLEIVRMLSAELEYSQENLDALLELFC